MPIKWGIAAAGRITHDFVTAVGTIPGEKHKIVAVADEELERAEEFAKKHGIEKFYKGFEKLAKDPNVFIVYIGTLNPFHYSVARLMLEHGKHVLCEKPICLHYDDAKQLYQIARSQNLFLMEAMWSRCFPSYEYLNKILSDGSLGEIKEINVQHGFKALGVERIRRRELGGGITLDIGIYTIQLGQLVFKQFPDDISVKGKLVEGVDVESEIILHYGNERKLHAKVSGLEDYKNDAQIIGTKGQLKLHNYWCCDSITNIDGSVMDWPLPMGKYDFNHTNACGLRYEAEEVRNCLKRGLLESPLYTQEQSLEMLLIEEKVKQQLGLIYDKPV